MSKDRVLRMEFNAHSFNLPGKTLFETIRADWEAAGYELPRLIFWNLCSRTKGAPLQENKNGLALVSGFSQNIVTMVMGESFDPYNLLLETLNSDRYRLVEEMLT